MAKSIPYLKKTENAKQVIVRGEPFLILGAELQNSSMTCADYMKPVWPQLAADNINTVLGAVTWEQIEPVEGKFDFSALDQCILDARAQGLHLILLWFGSWKNGVSTYVPAWIKRDAKRFPRVMLRKGSGRTETSDTLSMFESEALKADAKAFKALMAHVAEIDGDHSTVIMVQVENEVGCLGDSRDASPAANKAFEQPVPHNLVEKLKDDFDSLHADLKANLSYFRNSSVSKGTWKEVFGDSLATDELFMAYHYAQYVNHIASDGKSAYPLPLYVNVWQNYASKNRDKSTPIVAGGGSNPGDYPSGGGVTNVIDIWQLFAPNIDFVAPDIYLNDYSSSCANYRHRNQPLFIPEQRRDEYGARRIWDAIGTHLAIGTSPFGIDTVRVEHGHNPYAKHYGLLQSVSKIILDAQREHPHSTYGFLFDDLPTANDNTDPSDPHTITFGPWHLKIERSFVFGRPSPGSGMIIHLGPSSNNKFLLIGWGFQVTFTSTSPTAHFTGILSSDEKEVLNHKTGELKTARMLNGDETRGGKFVIMPSEDPDYGGFPISVTIPARTGIAEVEVYALEG